MTPVTMMIAVLWSVTMCTQENIKRRFSGTCHHLRVSNLKTEGTYLQHIDTKQTMLHHMSEEYLQFQTQSLRAQFVKLRMKLRMCNMFQ